MLTNNEALEYFVKAMHDGKIEYRNGELWRMWELRRGWLQTPRRAEKFTHGYYMLRVNDKAIGKALYVMAHRVVWSYFNGPASSDLTINHKNGIKTDNRIDNLELVTVKENANHAHRTGLMRPRKGIDHFRAKLTDDDVRTIRDLASSGKYLHREIAAMFGVRTNQVSRIAGGKRRADVK